MTKNQRCPPHVKRWHALFQTLIMCPLSLLRAPILPVVWRLWHPSTGPLSPAAVAVVFVTWNTSRDSLAKAAFRTTVSFIPPLSTSKLRKYYLSTSTQSSYLCIKVLGNFSKFLLWQTKRISYEWEMDTVYHTFNGSLNLHMNPTFWPKASWSCHWRNTSLMFKINC